MPVCWRLFKGGVKEKVEEEGGAEESAMHCKGKQVIAAYKSIVNRLSLILCLVGGSF